MFMILRLTYTPRTATIKKKERGGIYAERIYNLFDCYRVCFGVGDRIGQAARKKRQTARSRKDAAAFGRARRRIADAADNAADKAQNPKG